MAEEEEEHQLMLNSQPVVPSGMFLSRDEA